MQFIHESDVGQALLLCIVAAGPAGTYNIAGDGIVTAHDVARELGLTSLPLPVGITQRAARALAALPTPPFAPEVTAWIEAASHPVIIDTSKAKQDLGWEPRHSGIEALRAALPTNTTRTEPST
jgi:nucleoside-diphosphate-sugar epimerase